MKRKYIYAIALLAILAGNSLSLHGQNKRYNYVHSKTMLDKEGEKCLETTKYYNAFGVADRITKHGFTPSGLNLVTREERTLYDRDRRTWLPLASSEDFIYEYQYETKAKKFYGDTAPYTDIEYETYSNGRIRQQYGAGAEWKNNEKCVRTNYLTNTASGSLTCRHYTIQDSGSENFALQQDGIYANATLEVTETIDEDGNKSYNFTDYHGNVLLTRQMEGDIPHDTYYLYTLSGKIQAVIPPALADMTSNNGRYDMATIRKYAYLYRYDRRDRLTEKWIPGSSAPVRTIYDKADRPILTQDANLRTKNQWMLTKYDIHGRAILSGLLTAADSFETLTNSIGKQMVTETYTGNQANGSYGYTQNFIPGNIETLSVTYYDNYRFLEQSTSFINFTADAISGTYYLTPKGQITGELVFALGDANRKRYVTHYYNNRSWEIQGNCYDSNGLTDRSYTQYDFAGNPLKMKHTQSGVNSTPINEVYTYTYDLGERLTQVKHKLNDNPEVILTANEYDEVCRLKQKTLHNGKIALEYEYNIRGWLTKVGNPLFTQTLHYTDGAGIHYYGGNISSMNWKTSKTPEQGYKFTYDGLSRLKDAVYGEGSNLSTYPDRFNEQVTSYDKMGNILGLKRNGQTAANQYGLIDNLTLSYDGNQLKSVNDNAVSSAYQNGFEFKDGAKQATEYFYDANGNLTKDLNKNITEIQYNCLNLPQKITFSDGGTISYVYSPDGKKLRTVHNIGSQQTVTDYYGNAIYENGVLGKLLTEQGYITLSDKKYHYYLQDHQGNNRVVADQNGTVEEENHYYPFGGLFANSTNTQLYKYNGKELDSKNGLNWYDYGARQYDAAIGRWHVGDPKAEKYYGISPYAYCTSNPVNAIDPDGKKIIFVNGYLGFGSPEGGKAYWNNSFIKGAKSFFSDDTTPYFTNVEHGALSWASGRYVKGYEYAEENYASLVNGMKEGETFKFVSHSMGGAFATGMQEYLEEKGWTVDNLVFINTYQSGDVKTKKDNQTFIIDYQNTNDPVLFWLDPNLGLGKIKNSDIKIREKSEYETKYIHKGPISSGEDFWKEMRKLINEILNQ